MSLVVFLRHEAQAAWRTQDAGLAGLVVVLGFLVLALYSFDSTGVSPTALSYTIWAPVLYGGLVAASRSSQRTLQGDAADRLRLAAIEAWVPAAARVVVDGFLTAVLTFLAACGVCALLGTAFPIAWVPLFLLAALAVAVVGGLVGGIAAQVRQEEGLLVLLAVPVLAPLLQVGTHATQAAATGTTIDGALLTMAGYDLLLLAAAWWMWPFLMESDA